MSVGADGGVDIGAPTEGELEAVASLSARCFGRGWTIEELSAERRRPAAELLVAREAGEVVAYALSWLVGEEGEILTLGVAPERRGRGLARRLVEHLLRRASRRGVERVHLEVRRSNAAARALYERCGFAVAGTRPRYYADGEDAVLMAWSAS